MSMGLDDVSAFDPDDKIVEYRFKTPDKLVDMNVSQFADTLASDAPAPGGGSKAALCGCIAASLATMASNLTHGKKDHQSAWKKMEEVGVEGQGLKKWFLDAIDRDTDSFNAVMDAMSLPKKTDEQKAVRNTAIMEANKQATLVPLEVLEKTLSITPLLEKVSRDGNPNCASDVGVGTHCMLTCAEGAAMNVRINLPEINDEGFKHDCMNRLEKALMKVRSTHKELIALIDGKL